MRQIILDSQGMQIPVEFDEEQGTIRVAGVRVSIIEVTDATGIRLQALAQVRSQRGQSWTERRIYMLSGAQFWKLISDETVDYPEQAGLSEAKQMEGGRGYV